MVSFGTWVSRCMMSDSIRQWSEMPGCTCICSIRLGFDVTRRSSMLFDTGLVTSCGSALSSKKSMNFSCIALYLLLLTSRSSLHLAN